MAEAAAAAQALLSPTTDSHVRTQASQYLEQWKQSPEAWNILPQWIMHQQDPGIAALAIQLLQAKVRREIPRPTASTQYLQELKTQLRVTGNPALLNPLAILLASIYVRTDDWSFWDLPTDSLSIKIIENVPTEIDDTTSTPALVLTNYHHGILQLSSRALPSYTSALVTWVHISHISLTQLLQTGILQGLLAQINSGTAVIESCKVITEALLVPTDACTDTRKQATSLIVQNDMRNIVQQSKESEEVFHALEQMIGTLLSEDSEDFVEHPAEQFLTTVLTILNHETGKAKATILEGLLTIQEIPTSDRHEHWKEPLFMNVLQILVRRIQYPCDDEDDFAEHRRLVKDVIVSTYFLLRSKMIEALAQSVIKGSTWNEQEGALFALVSIAREVSARVKSKGGGTTLSEDRQQTIQIILALVHKLSHADPVNVQKELASSMVEFIGGYAPSWLTICDSKDLFHLLKFCSSIFGSQVAPMQASRAIRALLVNFSGSPILDSNELSSLLKEVVHCALRGELEALNTIMEGCMRSCMQIQCENNANLLLGGVVVEVLTKADEALRLLPERGEPITNQAQTDNLSDLSKCLIAIEILVRFSDSSNKVVHDMMQTIWPFLEKVTGKASDYEDTLIILIRVHESILKNLPEITTPMFPTILQYVVHVFDKAKNPAALGYMATAIEIVASPCEEVLFRNLLDHVSSSVFNELSNGIETHLPLVTSFYELIQRYLLFCPSAMLSSERFPSIIRAAIQYLQASKGERESARAILNLFAKLFGWRDLRVSDEIKATLNSNSHVLDEQIYNHGEGILKICLEMVVNGPQMLGPSASDCIFSLVSTTKSWPVPEDATSSVAKHWLIKCSTSSSDASLFVLMSEILMNLVDGSKSKPKVKHLLTDYSRVCRGEITPDSLSTYTL